MTISLSKSCSNNQFAYPLKMSVKKGHKPIKPLKVPNIKARFGPDL